MIKTSNIYNTVLGSLSKLCLVVDNQIFELYSHIKILDLL